MERSGICGWGWSGGGRFGRTWGGGTKSSSLAQGSRGSSVHLHHVFIGKYTNVFPLRGVVGGGGVCVCVRDGDGDVCDGDVCK